MTPRLSCRKKTFSFKHTRKAKRAQQNVAVVPKTATSKIKIKKTLQREKEVAVVAEQCSTHQQVLKLQTIPYVQYEFVQQFNSNQY